MFKKKIKGTVINKCVFCNKRPETTVNSQGFNCCIKCRHKNIEAKCHVCGSFMEVKKGSYGAYFKCYDNCSLLNVHKLNELGLVSVYEKIPLIIKKK